MCRPHKCAGWEHHPARPSDPHDVGREDRDRISAWHHKHAVARLRRHLPAHWSTSPCRPQCSSHDRQGSCLSEHRDGLSSPCAGRPHRLSSDEVARPDARGRTSKTGYRRTSTRSWNPSSFSPMGCSTPPVRAKQVSGRLAIEPGASSSMVFGLLTVLAVDRRQQDVDADHESVSGSGEPTSLSHTPTKADDDSARARQPAAGEPCSPAEDHAPGRHPCHCASDGGSAVDQPRHLTVTTDGSNPNTAPLFVLRSKRSSVQPATPTRRIRRLPGPRRCV
jgi:hypothetical protein